MPTVALADGRLIEVPPGLGPNGTALYLRDQGVPAELLPEAARADAAATSPLASSGPLEDAAIGAGLYILNRTPGMRQNVAGLEPPDTLAATLGGMLPPTAIGALLPGSGLAGIAAQGGLSAGLEGLRGGSPQDMALEGGFGAAGTVLGDMFGRAVKGAFRTFNALRNSGVLTTTDDMLRTAAETVGGRAIVDRVNQRAMNRAAAASFGASADQLTPDVLNQAAAQLGQQFDQLVPDQAIIDRAGLDAALAAIEPGALGPRVTRNLPAPGQPLDGRTFRALRAALAERARGFVGDSPNLADDLGMAVEELDAAAERALGPQYRAQFRQVREMWKNLRIVESLQSVRAGNNVSAPQLTTRLAQEGAGYGTSFLRDTRNVLPGTQSMFDVARTLVNDAAGRIGNSGTATRAATVGGLSTLAGLATGATTPASLATGAGALALGQVAGMASVGQPAAAAGRAGAAIARDKQ